MSEGLVAVDNIHGWILSGSFKPNRTNVASIKQILSHGLKVDRENFVKDTAYVERIERFWKIEDCSAVEKEKNKFDFNEFLKNVHFNSGRYSVPLSWKLDHKLLPDNYTLSFDQPA